MISASFTFAPIEQWVETMQDETEWQRLVDVEAAPIPPLAYPLQNPPGAVVGRRIRMIVFCLVLSLASLALLLHFRMIFLAIVLTGFFTTAAVIFLFLLKDPLTPCPFCGKWLEYPDKRAPFQCKNCWEYSVFDEHGVHAFTPPISISAVPTFKCPALEGPFWPRACVVCGAPPVRLEEVGTEKPKDYQTRATLKALGLWLPFLPAQVKIKGIPYCNQHSNGLRIDSKIPVGQQVWLYWCSFPMMRRYLGANRKTNRPLLVARDSFAKS